jgi:hypothetical protein
MGENDEPIERCSEIKTIIEIKEKESGEETVTSESLSS